MSSRQIFHMGPEQFSRIAVSLLFLIGGFTCAWLNLQTQRERILINSMGIEVLGNISSKFQTLQSSGRSTIEVNTFRVYYFDNSTEPVHDPIILDAFGKEIMLSDGQAAVGNFHSFEILNVPDELYEQTEEGDQLPIIYLPESPEKVWLKSMVEGKTAIDFTGPMVFILIGLLLALVPFVSWPRRIS